MTVIKQEIKLIWISTYGIEVTLVTKARTNTYTDWNILNWGQNTVKVRDNGHMDQSRLQWGHNSD